MKEKKKMKFLRRTNNTNTIRTIRKNDQTVTYGVMGTVGDLLTVNIMSYCDAPCDRWAFIDTTGKATFFKAKDALIKHVEKINH